MLNELIGVDAAGEKVSLLRETQDLATRKTPKEVPTLSFTAWSGDTTPMRTCG